MYFKILILPHLLLFLSYLQNLSNYHIEFYIFVAFSQNLFILHILINISLYF